MSFLEAAGLYPLVPVTSGDGGWEVVGDMTNILHISLAPGQEVQVEPGTMIYASNGVKAQVRMGGFARIVFEGQWVKVIYQNSSKSPGYIGISSNFPGTVIPFNLSTMGNQIQCKHEAFLGSMDPKTKISFTRLNTSSCLACCCAGMPMLMETVNTDKWVFLSAHGTIMQKQLASGEEIVVDTRGVVAVSSSVTVDVVRSGSCATMCCADEGMFNTSLKGPGLVVLTSMSIQKIRSLFPVPAEKVKKGETAGK